MQRYSKNDKPYIYTAFPSEVRDSALGMLELLSKGGIDFWYADELTRKEAKRVQGAFSVLLFVNKAYANSDDFHAVVNEAVNCGKNILCVYLEEFEMDSWMQLQLGSQQSLSTKALDEEFAAKLKEAFIFKDMKVTDAQKKFQRNKAVSFVAIPVIAALILFFTVINPLLIAPARAANAMATRWGLTVSDLESITELHIVGNQSFDSKVHAWYVDGGKSVAYMQSMPDGQEHEMSPIPVGNLTSEDLEILRYMPNLRWLELEGQQITDISPIFETNVEVLRLNCNPITSIEGIEKMAQLKELILNDTDVIDISPVYSLEHLEMLQIDNCYVSDISGVGEMPSLIKLLIRDTRVNKLPYLGEREHFELDVRGLKIYDMSGIKDIKSFKDLKIDSMGDSMRPQDIMPYITGTPIDAIGWCGVYSLEDIKGLYIPEGCGLGLANNYLTSLEGIERFEGIEALQLFHTNNMPTYLTDLTPILRIKSLKYLDLSPDMKDMAEEQLKDAHFEIHYKWG